MENSKEKKNEKKKRKKIKNNNRRWYKWKNVNIKKENRNGNMFLDKRKKEVKGEQMGNKFRRKLWMYGGRSIGYEDGIEIKVV